MNQPIAATPTRSEAPESRQVKRARERKLKSDFKYFLYQLWKFLRLPAPTPVQYEIADYLVHGPRRKIVEAFRGVGKSWITSAYVLWRLYCDAQYKFLVVSASKVRADDFSIFTKRLIDEWPILAHLRAKDGQRDSNVSFDVGPALAAHAPSVKSVGISGQLAGSRATEVIADDIEVPNNSQTQLMREKLSEAVKEFDAILVPDGRITFLGTPQTEESIYNVLPTRGYDMRVWPGRFPKTQKQREMYAGRLAPRLARLFDSSQVEPWQVTDPIRFSHEDLLEREASYGRSGFALQFMLDTSLSDADRYPLKLADLIVMDIDQDYAPVQLTWATGPDQIDKETPNVGFTGDRIFRPMYISKDFAAYTGSVMFIDPAGRGQDETGYAVVKMLGGRLFVRRCGGLAGGYTPETLHTLALIAKSEKVNHILVEDNFGDGMWTELFKPILRKHHNVSIEEVHSVGQKERRIIDVLEPVLNQHRLVVDRSLFLSDSKSTEDYPGEKRLTYQLFYQLTRITKDKGALRHEDRLEALAGAVAYWVEQMSGDTDQNEDNHHMLTMENSLEEYLGHVKPGSTKRGVWGRVPGR
jgi:hypothetical protein